MTQDPDDDKMSNLQAFGMALLFAYCGFLTGYFLRPDSAPPPEWQIVWANWTNKPVGIARDVNGRLEQLDVKHDRPKPY